MYAFFFALIWFLLGAIAVGLFALLASTTKELKEANPKQHTAQRALAIGIILLMMCLFITSLFLQPC